MTLSDPPPVSVVIPAYNRAGTIRAAIESVLRQSWEDFELLVVDDGSTDATLDAAAKVTDPRLRLVESPANGGAAAARNRGVEHARGTWIAFQDSDDEWLPTKLEKQMARLLAPAPSGTAFVGAYCGLLTLGGLDDDPDARLQLRYVPDPAIGTVEGDITTPLLLRNQVSTQTLVVRRDSFIALGRFDAAMTPIEDWDFVLRLAQTGPIAFVDEPLVHQRFSANSITRHQAARLKALDRIVEKNRALYEKRPDLLGRLYYGKAGTHRRRGEFAEARACLALARRNRPADPRLWAMSAYVGLRGALGPGSA